MKLSKQLDNDINPEDPWEENTLSRKKVAEYLTPVIASVREPFAISLNSSYGTGKTYFVKRWKQDLENKGFNVAYFNAWETDFSNDPLSAFMSLLDKTYQNKPELKAQVNKIAKNTAGFMRKKALPILLKGLFRKALGEEGVNEFIEELTLDEDEVSKLLSASAMEALTSQKAAEDSMVAFREQLSELVNKLNQNLELKDEFWPEIDDRKKLIIFIDDLDRCRPNYAIELLETIKHLFSVEGLLFIISVDIDQLKNSIQSVYGQGIETEGFLRKFVDWEFNLPKPSNREYTKYLIDKFDLGSLEYFNDCAIDCELFFSIICRKHEITLRKQEQIFTHLNLALRTNYPNIKKFYVPLFLLTVLKFCDFATYEKFKNSAVNNFLINFDNLGDLFSQEELEESDFITKENVQGFINALICNRNYQRKLPNSSKESYLCHTLRNFQFTNNFETASEVCCSIIEGAEQYL